MQTIITQITENAKQLLDKELKRIGNGTDCPIQEGMHDILQINILNTNVRYALNDFDWESFNHKFQLPELEKVTVEEFAPLAEQIAQNLENYFIEKKHTILFQYQFKVVFKFRSFKKVFAFEDLDKKSALKKAMDTYIQQVFVDKTHRVKENRDVIIFCSKILDFSLMQLSEKEIINLIENAFEVFKEKQNKKLEKEFISGILHQLTNWKENEFFPIYYDIEKDFMYRKMTPKPEFAMQVPKSAPKLDPKKIRPEDAGKVELFVRQGLWRIKNREPYGVGKADLEQAANEFGSAQAKMYLKKGSGMLPDSLIHYKDEDLECKANDVFATISISIKNENSTAYSKALDFVIRLLNANFPKSYQIKFSSKAEKKFLPIKGLAKSQTHRFFGQALGYPELFDKLQDYARTAMVEFEWYEDVEEGESSCMPGTYAVFGLGLESEKYFPLVEKYFRTLDDEHQSVQYEFINEFAVKWGISEKTLPILCDGVLAGQFGKPFKSIKAQITSENKDWVEKFITENYDKYDQESINYLFFGKKFL